MMFNSDEPIEVLSLTALQRHALVVGGFLPQSLVRLFDRPSRQVESILLTLPQLHDLQRSLQIVLPGSVAPHTRRYEAILRRVGQCLTRQAAREQRRQAILYPPRPGPLRGWVFQFRVQLLGIDPPIWRRFQIRDVDLAELHLCLMAVMGWERDFHHHRFVIRGQTYRAESHRGTTAEFLGLHGRDERDVLLSDLFPLGSRPSHSLYEYDVLVSWQHVLFFEGHATWDFGADDPICLGGGRACPWEAFGGVAGYQAYLANHDHPARPLWEAEQARRGRFNPEAFTIPNLPERHEAMQSHPWTR